MAAPKDLPQDIGEFIKDLRQTARISLRQLADRAGVSNPYLSQIERGLRKPSAEVLQQLASALRVSTPAMYLRAGLLDGEGQQGVLAAIAVDPDLTIAQKQSLSQIYETFRNETARQTPEAPESSPSPAESSLSSAEPTLSPAEPTLSPAEPALSPAEPSRSPAEAEPSLVVLDEDEALRAVVRDVSVVENGGAPPPPARPVAPQTTQPDDKS